MFVSKMIFAEKKIGGNIVKISVNIVGEADVVAKIADEERERLFKAGWKITSV